MIVERALAAAEAGHNYEERIAEDLATILSSRQPAAEKDAFLRRLRLSIARSLNKEENAAVFKALAFQLQRANHDLAHH